jgi:hypothetical protein
MHIVHISHALDYANNVSTMQIFFQKVVPLGPFWRHIQTRKKDSLLYEYMGAETLYVVDPEDFCLDPDLDRSEHNPIGQKLGSS